MFTARLNNFNSILSLITRRNVFFLSYNTSRLSTTYNFQIYVIYFKHILSIKILSHINLIRCEKICQKKMAKLIYFTVRLEKEYLNI